MKKVKLRRTISKGLTSAIVLGILSGVYLPQTFAAEYTGSTGITGDIAKDGNILGKDVLIADNDGTLTYTFKGNNIFNMI